MDIQEVYEKWAAHIRLLGDLGYALRVLDYDAKVFMPPKGIAVRSKSHKYLAGHYHQLTLDKQYIQRMDQLLDHPQLSDYQRRTVEAAYRIQSRKQNLSIEFVQNSAELYANAYQAWLQAREEDCASIFLPWLDKIVANKLEEVDRAKYDGHPYEYYTTYFEPGLSLTELDEIFLRVKTEFAPLLQQANGHEPPHIPAFTESIPAATQKAYCNHLIKSLGFDTRRGRLDESEHPFTNGMTCNDVRITTRIRPDNLEFTVWSTLHELGHAHYEQHLPEDQYGLPGSLAASFGVHESQARFWENHVGRNIDFWRVRYPEFQDQFPAFKQVGLDDFHAYINRVSPNLIRTEADELHYHLHVLIRYEFEKEMLEKTIDVRDADEVWREKYAAYLGVKPSCIRNGLLQDMHWAQGQWGYFPSYSIGSFLAAQLASALLKDHPDAIVEAANGRVGTLLHWMNTHIYQHGRTRKIQEIAAGATGSPLDLEYFIQYVSNKYALQKEKING